VSRTRSSPSKQLAAFLDRYEPAIAARTRAALAILRKRLGTATELVYDNYNALAIGFGPSDRGGHRARLLAPLRRIVLVEPLGQLGEYVAALFDQQGKVR